MNIVERLKAKGLDVAEEVAAQVVEELFVMAEEEVEKVPESFRPMAKMTLPVLKSYAMSLVDKIDGQDDEGR